MAIIGLEKKHNNFIEESKYRDILFHIIWIRYLWSRRIDGELRKNRIDGESMKNQLGIDGQSIENPRWIIK